MRNVWVTLLLVGLLGAGLYVYKDYKDLKTRKKVTGNFINTENGLYKSVSFQGRSTCIVIDGVFNDEHVSSYIIDGKYIRVKSNISELIFRIVNDSTIIGNGYAEGRYVKGKIRAKAMENLPKQTKEQTEYKEYARKKVGNAFGKK